MTTCLWDYCKVIIDFARHLEKATKRVQYIMFPYISIVACGDLITKPYFIAILSVKLCPNSKAVA